METGKEASLDVTGVSGGGEEGFKATSDTVVSCRDEKVAYYDHIMCGLVTQLLCSLFVCVCA